MQRRQNVQHRPDLPPSTITSLSKSGNPPPQLRVFSNDAAFVAQVLRERERNEYLRAARAMLYDAYMQAFKAGESSQSS